MKTTIDALVEALEKIACVKNTEEYPGHYNGALHLRCGCCGYRWCPGIEAEDHSPNCAAQIARAALTQARAEQALGYPSLYDITGDIKGLNTLLVPVEEVKQLEEMNRQLREQNTSLDAECGRLEAENAELRKDAERYRWLKLNATTVRAGGRYLMTKQIDFMNENIDAALKDTP